MNTACVHQPVVINTHRAPWRRFFDRLGDVLTDVFSDAVQAWRAAVQQQRRLRALQGLSAHTRRDLGLDDAWPQPPQSSSVADYERMRW